LGSKGKKEGAPSRVNSGGDDKSLKVIGARGKLGRKKKLLTRAKGPSNAMRGGT